MEQDFLKLFIVRFISRLNFLPRTGGDHCSEIVSLEVHSRSIFTCLIGHFPEFIGENRRSCILSILEELQLFLSSGSNPIIPLPTEGGLGSACLVD